MVIGSNLGRTKLHFLFAKNLFVMEGKGHRNHSRQRSNRRAAKMIVKQPLNDH